jgi:type III restriction enzyme
MFGPEYASIFGIPFSFAQTGPQAADVKPPKPTRRVHAVRARVEAKPALEIRFPRLLGYRLRLPSDRLAWTWSEDSRFQLTPDRFPNRAKVESILGAGETIALEDCLNQRPATVAFHVAGHALRGRFRDDEGALKPWLFPQLLRASREWIDTQLVCADGMAPGLFLWKALADEAALRIHNACVAGAGESEPVVLPVLAPFEPEGSSAHVDMLTTKERLWRTAEHLSHVNLVVGDSDWEIAFCETLESMPEVVAYVKNHGLGFEVPYATVEGDRRYRPDFIVKIGPPEDPLNLVVEIKGYRDEDAALKATTIRDQWVPAVNNDGRFGRWAFVEVRDVFTSMSDVRAAIRAAAGLERV